MADYSISADQVGLYGKQLKPKKVDVVTIERNADKLELWSDGTAAIYFTVDGVDPEIEGQNGYELPPSKFPTSRLGIDSGPGAGNTIVKLISAGTPRYSITAPNTRP